MTAPELSEAEAEIVARFEAAEVPAEVVEAGAELDARFITAVERGMPVGMAAQAVYGSPPRAGEVGQ